MRKGFTLIELLIAIAIIAALAAGVILVLNPVELARKGRDSVRLADFSMLDSAIALTLVESVDTGTGTTGIVYTSLPDTDSGCASHVLPPLPDGMEYRCVTEENLRKVDGAGWIPINFAGVLSGSPLAVLPVDPVNTAEGDLYYTYSKGSWLFTATLESEKYSLKMTEDKGPGTGRYEVGSDLNLLASTTFGNSIVTRIIPEQTVELGGSLSLDLKPYFRAPIGESTVIGVNCSELKHLGGGCSVLENKILSLTVSSEVPPGSYTVIFEVWDLERSISKESSVTIVIPPASADSIPDQTVKAGEEIRVDIAGYIGESSSVKFADGSDLPKWMSHDGNVLTIAPMAENIGEYNLMALRDSNNEKIPFALSVTDGKNEIPEQIAHPGEFFSFDPAPYFADPPEFTFSQVDAPGLPGWMSEREHRYIEGTPDIESATYSMRISQPSTGLEKDFTLRVE